MPGDVLADMLPSEIDCQDENEKTITKWKEQLIMIHFIYEQAYDLFSRLVRVFGLVVFLLTTTTSFVTPWGVSNNVIFIISLSCTLVSGISQVFSLQDRSNNYLSYLAEVQKFLALIISRETLPCDLREPSRDMILKNKDMFLHIVATAPDIPNYLYEKSQDQFKKRNIKSRRTSQIAYIV